jgi:hypothetical protein
MMSCQQPGMCSPHGGCITLIASKSEPEGSYQKGYDEGRRQGTRHRVADVQQLEASRAADKARIEVLQGLLPEFPPRPPEGSGMPRYGLRWNGPDQPLAVPMDDGYWMPWHLAKARIDELEELLSAIRFDLPARRDWLDPVLEKRIDAALAQRDKEGG